MRSRISRAGLLALPQAALRRYATWGLSFLIAVTTPGVSSANTGVAIWSDNTNIPKYNSWSGSAFGTEASTANMGARWRIMAAADALPSRDEKITVGVDPNGIIRGQLWNGSIWAGLAINPLNASAVSETYWWAFDVAYAQQSGNAMLVWNNNTANNLLQYSVWNGTSWSSKSTISAYAGAEPQQMHIAAKPNADEMILVVNDSNADDYAIVWNGSSWGNALMLDASGTAENDQTALYPAYERQSGRAMVVYGKEADPNVYYRIWTGSSWNPEGSISAPSGVTAQASWIMLASDPMSNRIALTVLTTGGTAADIWLNVWSGTAWQTSFLATTTATGSTFPAVAVAFESSSGDGLATYGVAGANTVRYRIWSAGSGWSVTEGVGPDIGAVPNSMTLDSDGVSDHTMLSVQNGSSQLNYVLWDGSSWGTPSQQETFTAETKNQPFAFVWDRQPGEGLPVQLAGFEGRVIGEGLVQLQWSTVSEVNNFGFYVQRRVDAETEFSDLPGAFVPGHGTTLEPQHYNFTDVTAAQGVRFYRLRQVDLDGSIHYSDPIRVDLVTGVEEHATPTEFRLEQNYPNPFNPSTVISYQVPARSGVEGPVASEVRLVVCDLLGREVAVLVNESKAPGSYSVRFNAHGLASGVYLYKLTAGPFSETKRLVLTK